MATFSGRGDGTGVKNPRLKSPFPDIEPRFGGVFFYADANALYAFKSRGFGGEIGLGASETGMLSLLVWCTYSSLGKAPAVSRIGNCPGRYHHQSMTRASAQELPKCA